MTRSCADVFTTDMVAELAGPPAFARGAEYHRQGRVETPLRTGGRVRAVVRGSMPYTVQLWHVDGTPAWSCTCPVGDEDLFCKHCVALALAVDPPPGGPVGGAEPEEDVGAGDAELRGHLVTLGVEHLVELVVEAAGRDWRLHERLTADAAAAAGSGLDEQMWRQCIDTAFGPGVAPVSYEEAADWAEGVDAVVDLLDDLVDTGHADAVVRLAEHAHRCAEAAIQYVDDSDGWLTDVAERLAELHIRACARAMPEPVALARRLVELELSSELDTFHRAALSHAPALGRAGIAEYGRLLEPRWRALPPADEAGSTERWRVFQALSGVALAAGDPDELIRVRRGDLRSPDDHHEIASALIDAGRRDEAVAWARRGLDAFADRPRQTTALREVLASLLRARGDTGAAVELYWKELDAYPSIDAYRALMAAVDGHGAPDLWRRRAIASLRTRIAAQAAGDGAPRPGLLPAPSTTLVEILLYEGDVDAAWGAASEHGCPDALWLTLARAREATHPLDAAAIYEREARTHVDTRSRAGYDHAVRLLARIRRLTGAGGEPERFDRLVGELRAEHKRKRSFMALLDGRGW